MRKPFLWASRKGWYLRVNIPDSKKVKTIRLGATKKQAYEQWELLKRQSSGGRDVSGAMTVETVIDKRLAHLTRAAAAGRLNAGTVERVAVYLSSFTASISETLSVEELKPHHVTSWLAKLEGDWKQNTQHHAAAAVKAAVKWAWREGLIQTDALEAVSVPRGDGRDFVISRECYESMLISWKQKRPATKSFCLVLNALWLSGCRPGEIAKVNVENIDGDLWILPDHKNKKKKKRPRVVYLSPCLATLTKVLAGNRKSGPLFRRSDGERWNYVDLRRTFYRMRERTDISDKCVLYSFRHTWITQAMLAGVDVATVAEMAGTSIQMIDRHYGHLSKHKNFMVNAAARVSSSRWDD